MHNLRHWIDLVEDAASAGFTVKAYHGTNKDFDTFSVGSKMGSGSREGPLGIWFTDNPHAASDFAEFSSRGYHDGGSVIPVRLRLRHPLVVDRYDQIRDLVDRFTTFAKPNYEAGGRQIRMMKDKVDYAAAREWLKSQGYDGIMLPNTLTDSPDKTTPITQYVVLDPNQVRSEFANYDPNKLDSGNISEDFVT